MSSVHLSLSTILAATQGTLLQAPTEAFSNVVIDGRQALPGALYVAIQGAHHNGHDFIPQAVEHGATGVLVHVGSGTSIAKSFPHLTVVEIPDTIVALGQVAKAHRNSPEIADHLQVIGITGSFGKTTTKEMMSEILKAYTQDKTKVLSTEGNLNNHLGVPLTLLRLHKEHRYAVIEMGMSALGEIAYLTTLSQPHIGIITGVGPAHLETLGSIENVAKAKGELFWGLPDGGIAVFLEGESLPIQRQAKRAGTKNGRILAWTAALEESTSSSSKVTVEVKAEQINGLVLTMHCAATEKLPKEVLNIRLRLLGTHQAENAALAATAARALGIPGQAIVQGLEQVKPHKHRGEQFAISGRLIIDDCYNANPASVKAAACMLGKLRFRGQLCQGGKAWMVLGDMLELGKDETWFHQEVGNYIAEQEIDGIFTLGSRAAQTAQAIARHGRTARAYESIEALSTILLKIVQPGDILLVKGSRGMQLERLFPLLQKGWEPCRGEEKETMSV